MDNLQKAIELYQEKTEVPRVKLAKAVVIRQQKVSVCCKPLVYNEQPKI